MLVVICLSFVGLVYPQYFNLPQVVICYLRSLAHVLHLPTYRLIL